jgi:hypothetical protein
VDVSILRKLFHPNGAAQLNDRIGRIESTLQGVADLQMVLAERLERISPILTGLSESNAAFDQHFEHISEQNVERLDRLNVRLAETGYAASLASKIGHQGEFENALYRSIVGAEKPISSAALPVPLSSSLCQQVHFCLDQYRFWIQRMRDKPRFLRKQWEFFFIAQALFERGMLQGGRKGIGFGVGQEPLPALFASFGVEILATDQSYEDAQRAGWAKSGQHSRNLSALNERGICTDEMFHQLVQFAEVDMNGLPAHLAAQFDFCWSSCALEHLGSLKHGTKFIKGSLDLLKPGGIAVHTTEFNLSSDDRTIESEGLSVYRRRDIEELVQEIEGEGHTVEPIDWTRGNGLAETVVDLPPWGRGEPHLRLLLGDFECTSIGLLITRNEAVGCRPNFLEQRFSEVYGKALWGDDETRSGWGSKCNSGHVQTALEILRMVIPKYNILSVADIPCGDFNWQPLFLSDHAQVAYIGYDIVGSMIVDNKRKNPNREFRQLDITKQVPAKADLILCKDMFNHLTYADIRHAIGNMKRSGSTYLLASNDFTFPQNVDVVNEGSNDRPVDVLKAPLSYPAPLWNNHYMGLWLLALM